MSKDWTWLRDAPLPDLQSGDDVEVMWHGGTTARGNLSNCINWHLVVAFKVHGKVPRSTLDDRFGLVWEKLPGVNKIDRSYVEAFG